MQRAINDLHAAWPEAGVFAVLFGGVRTTTGRPTDTDTKQTWYMAHMVQGKQRSGECKGA